MGKIMLATGLIVAYGYMMEAFMAFYSADVYERYVTLNRMGGPYAVVYWSLIACNIVIPAGSLVAPAAHQSGDALCPGLDHQYRHVARALCDCGD